MKAKNCTSIEEIFPQTQESKDEKIRKEIINIFYSLADGRIPVPINFADIFTWLEKQGEQKSDWSEEDEWKFSDILALLRGGENCHYNTPDLFEWLKSLKSRIQPKQEWSEEDEDYYDAIITKLEVTQDDAALTDNQMEFLKSLKDKLQPQPKQEWSEEDEKMLNGIILRCEKYGYQEQINWLKSLKERIGWKPSDEQMDALDSTLQYSQVSHNSYEHLNSLYNDLKKLTE